MKSRDTLIGNFAVSKAGHDAGSVYVIVGEDDFFVYLSDGRLKTVQKPKKKKKKHIQIIRRTVSDALLAKMRSMRDGDDGCVRDEEIKFEIKEYLKRDRMEPESAKGALC